MALDLSSLEEKIRIPAGQPLHIPLVDIEEDPNQPRTVFSEQAMSEMIESIRMRGVKTPVSVRSHPHKPGKWMLNYGARRYRSSCAVGCETIPAFIDETHDDYDQVIENIQRDDLKPMELALFIKRRLNLGDKKQKIAQILGKNNATITYHLALIDLPACLEEVYSTGQYLSPKTLYELRNLYENYPTQVKKWCSQKNDITRQSVAELTEVLKKNKTASKRTNKINKVGRPKLNDKSDLDFETLKQPLLLIEFDNRLATVLLNRRPNQSNFIYIQFKDDNHIAEVEAYRCTIKELISCER